MAAITIESETALPPKAHVSNELRRLLSYLMLHHTLGFAIGMIATDSLLGGLAFSMAAPCISLLAMALKDGYRRALRAV